MARKASAKSAAAKRPAKRKAVSKPAAARPAAQPKGGMPFAMPTAADVAKMSRINVLTPEQAIELYKANAKIALDIINAAIDSTARVRRKQFEGEEQAREFGRRTARRAAETQDPQALMALGKDTAAEALEKSMHYWGEMFDLISEIQKRVFTLIEEQSEGMPGVKQARAAMAMMPDLRPMQNVISAMQGVVSSGGSAFESMQKVMGDMTRMAQDAIPGIKR